MLLDRNSYSNPRNKTISKCVAFVNGTDYYEKVKVKKIKKPVWTSEFECILYVPESAWQKSILRVQMNIHISGNFNF